MSDNTGICRQCGEAVVWVRSESGKNIACNPDLDDHDRSIYTESGERLTRGYGYICHWDTCKKGQRQSPGGGAAASDKRATTLAAMVQTWSLDELRVYKTYLSRTIGIQHRAGDDARAAEHIRSMITDAMGRGWGQS